MTILHGTYVMGKEILWLGARWRFQCPLFLRTIIILINPQAPIWKLFSFLPKHMLWVLKRIISITWDGYFEHPKHMYEWPGKKIFKFYNQLCLNRHKRSCELVSAFTLFLWTINSLITPLLSPPPIMLNLDTSCFEIIVDLDQLTSGAMWKSQWTQYSTFHL